MRHDQFDLFGIDSEWRVVDVVVAAVVVFALLVGALWPEVITELVDGL